MNIAGIDTNLLVSLDALLQERSVSGAAVRVGLSQPAMSHALQRLREHLGDALLERSGRSMILTARARELVEPVRSLVVQMAQIFEPTQAFDPRTTQRRFRVAMTDLVGAAILPGLCAAFEREASSAGLEISSPIPGGVVSELRAGELDVALGVFEQIPEGMQHEELYIERFICAVRRGHPIARQRLTLERYTQLKHVMVAPRGGSEGVVDRALARLGMKRSVVLTLPHFMVAPLVVASSDYILTGPLRSTAPVADRLKTFEPPVELAQFPISQLWDRRRGGDVANAWLRGLLARVCRAF